MRPTTPPASSDTCTVCGSSSTVSRDGTRRPYRSVAGRGPPHRDAPDSTAVAHAVLRASRALACRWHGAGVRGDPARAADDLRRR
jgi:hypothetical protein